MNKYPQSLLQISKPLKITADSPAITIYNQPKKISDDQLRQSVRPLSKMELKGQQQGVFMD